MGTVFCYPNSMSSLNLPIVTVIKQRQAALYRAGLLQFRPTGFLRSAMLSQHRQKTDVVNYARVALLCMATTMVVGFSKPGENLPQVSTGDSPDPGGLRPAAYSPSHHPEILANVLVVNDPDAIGFVSKDTGVEPASLAAKPFLRPFSFATDTIYTAILAGVSGRRMMNTRYYSQDRLQTELNVRRPNHFRGVGFPDIRTHRKKSRRAGHHAVADSYGWRRMISWRDADNTESRQEPIAHVRCMGLSPQAVANRADRYERLIVSMAVKYQISASLIKAVITEESCFNNKALSPVGAQGLMQLMPETAAWLKVKDPHDPEQNLRAGVRYLASLHKQFDSLELVLAAYNAGPGNVRKYKGVPPFAETQAYVQKVQAHYRRYVAATRLASR